jgi:hypothetical protein
MIDQANEPTVASPTTAAAGDNHMQKVYPLSTSSMAGDAFFLISGQ